jgi:hypothetical protein
MFREELWRRFIRRTSAARTRREQKSRPNTAAAKEERVWI